jgi:predicted nucleic acid-binding protein
MMGRIKVFIDTNELVSALWSDNGNPSTIVKLMPHGIIPFFNQSIFEEYSDVLNRPKFVFSVNKRLELLNK